MNSWVTWKRQTSSFFFFFPLQKLWGNEVNPGGDRNESEKGDNLQVKSNWARTSCHRLLCTLKPYTGLKMQQDCEKKEGKKRKNKNALCGMKFTIRDWRTWENTGRSLEVLPCLFFSHVLHKSSLALVHFGWISLCPDPVHLFLWQF